MEPHKDLSGIEGYKPDLNEGPNQYFRKALKFAQIYYSEQMEAIASVKFEDVSPDLFFQEYVWVVHATGFSAKAVGKFMPRLMEAYGSWDSLPTLPFQNRFEEIKKVCNNLDKAKAVYSTSKLMRDAILTGEGSWEEFRNGKLSSPGLLAKLPYIGKITCYHLGRNIGLLECVKPDLHLIRMAEHWGFKTCEEMCEAVRPKGMPLGIVDLVFWYSASTFGTLEIKKEGAR